MKRLIPLALSALAAVVPMAVLGAQDSVATESAATTSGEYPVDRIVAVVGKQPILWSKVQEVIFQRRAQGMELPSDSAGQIELARRTIEELIDEEVLIQQAAALKVEVADADVVKSVDAQIKSIRDRFGSEAEYREELRKAGFGTPEEYRRRQMDEARRAELQRRVIDKLREDGKIVPAPVTEAEVTAAFEQYKGTLPRRPATVTFRQIIVPPRPSEAARARARAKAESLLVEIRAGGNFEQIAKRESKDPGSAEVGGDLGWNRRGTMVPEFDRWMFAINPGQLSPVIETTFGYHIIRVDRVQPAEVKARHILIVPELDSTDVTRARQEADSVLRQWRAGVPFDTLVARHHDPAEEKIIPTPIDRERLPVSYQTALGDAEAGTVVGPFPIENPRTGKPKYVVAQLLTATPGGEYTVSDLRETIRAQLTQERSIRRVLDQLRRETFVAVRL